jgi:hypothetical protein
MLPTMLLLLSLILSSCSLLHSSEFSGFYTPNLKYNLEVYSGAWLQSKHLFLQNLDHIKEISSLESTTTGGLMRYQHSNTRFILMSRDYFDFQIEHLSSTTNVIGDDKHLMGHLTSITKRKGLWLKKIALGIPNTPSHKPFMNQTVVIIPFSTNSASSGSHQGNQPPDETQTLRLHFFESTFWSIYRYFPHIAICVSSPRDAEFIRTLQLPVFEIFHLEKSKGLAWELPRFALLTAHEAMASNPSWAQFQYLYFSEGDQLLHLRHQTEMMKFMSATKGKFALVPHRMQGRPLPRLSPRPPPPPPQTMILPKTLPPELRQYIQPAWRSTVYVPLSLPPPPPLLFHPHSLQNRGG